MFLPWVPLQRFFQPTVILDWMMLNGSPSHSVSNCIYRLVSKDECWHHWSLDRHAGLILIGPEVDVWEPTVPWHFEPQRSALMTLDLDWGQRPSGSLMKSWVLPIGRHKWWCYMKLAWCWFPHVESTSVRSNTSKQLVFWHCEMPLFVVCFMCVHAYMCV